MSDGASDCMRWQETINKAIFEEFEFEDDVTNGDKYLEVRRDTFICWCDAYYYWCIEYHGKELKIYPKNASDIQRLIDILI